jgi:hypothetical protein
MGNNMLPADAVNGQHNERSKWEGCGCGLESKLAALAPASCHNHARNEDLRFNLAIWEHSKPLREAVPTCHRRRSPARSVSYRLDAIMGQHAEEADAPSATHHRSAAGSAS